jgi:hypothetical protein
VADTAYQVTGFSYQGDGEFAYQGSTDVVPPVPQPEGGGGGSSRKPTINWQTGRKKRKRSLTDELFDSIEKSLREQVYGPPETEVQQADTAAPAIDPSQGIETALRELTRVASGYTDLSVRVAAIRKEIADHEGRERAARESDEDDDEFLMMS